VLARDAEQALQVARAHLPDAILRDHSRPKLNGAQVLAKPIDRALLSSTLRRLA
jgi:CheY-like chemotaxis protein